VIYPSPLSLHAALKEPNLLSISCGSDVIINL
jgi:hypothetical protein